LTKITRFILQVFLAMVFSVVIYVVIAGVLIAPVVRLAPARIVYTSEKPLWRNFQNRCKILSLTGACQSASDQKR